MTYRSLPLAVSAAPPRVLDTNTLKRGFFFLAVALMVIAPFSQDPLAMSVGAAVPWLMMQIVARPGMPAAVVYLLVWQWVQVFARVLQSMVDGEPMTSSLFGPTVGKAYWYMMASLVVLAIALRFSLGSLKAPTEEDRSAHFEWRPIDLFTLYVAMMVLAVACRFVVKAVPGLDQPVDALAKMKIVMLFMLFTNVMMTGRGTNLMWLAVGAEVAMGFTGLLSDFRSVFVYLAVAAIASRIPIKGISVVMGGLCASLLVFLALFWTAVKMEYRDYATGGEDSQALQVSLEDRMAYLGERLISVDAINWGQASYLFLVRLAYTDIFGSVIGVQETAPEPGFMRQWQEAIDHVTRPRVLFPNKAALSDTEVYVRLARGDPTEQIRFGTSISVGYMAENFVDLGFPGMLAGIFVIGLIYGGIIRYFMSLRFPWILKEGVVLALVMSVAMNGVEISLPKLLGTCLMFFLVYVLLARFAFQTGLNWLKGRSGFREAQLS